MFSWLKGLFVKDEAVAATERSEAQAAGKPASPAADEGLALIVVGEVLSKEKHPNADRLSLTRVKVAEDKVLDIVCGAPNVEVGQKVAVALVGAVLPNGMRIEEREVRGSRSSGMICAEDELALGANHDGVMVLDAALAVGTPIRQALAR